MIKGILLASANNFAISIRTIYMPHSRDFLFYSCCISLLTHRADGISSIIEDIVNVFKVPAVVTVAL